MAKGNGLEGLMNAKGFGCVKNLIKDELIPLMNHVVSYAANKNIKDYALSTIKKRLIKRRGHYDKEVFKLYVKEYIDEIKGHFSAYIQNKKILGLRTKLDYADINAYLEFNFHYRTIGNGS